MKTTLPAAGTASFQRDVRSHGGGTVRTGRVRIGSQGVSAGNADETLLRRQRAIADGAEARIEQLQQALSQFAPGSAEVLEPRRGHGLISCWQSTHKEPGADYIPAPALAKRAS